MEKFGNFEIFACVTAGVTNAQRIGVDKAGYIERDRGEFKGLGTINTIVLTNAYTSSNGKKYNYYNGSKDYSSSRFRYKKFIQS